MTYTSIFRHLIFQTTVLRKEIYCNIPSINQVIYVTESSWIVS